MRKLAKYKDLKTLLETQMVNDGTPDDESTSYTEPQTGTIDINQYLEAQDRVKQILRISVEDLGNSPVDLALKDYVHEALNDGQDQENKWGVLLIAIDGITEQEEQRARNQQQRPPGQRRHPVKRNKLNSGQRKKRLYANTQRDYNKDPSGTIDQIIKGTYGQEGPEGKPSIGDVETTYKERLELTNHADNEPVEILREVDYDN
jgi:hypothetical protein